jgi:tripartite-type tricarboxylate transporter receptor subunit TctC
VVPFSAGGGTDVVARLIAQELTGIWKQQVLVDNRTGASGTIGLAAVARAPADGHTVGVMIITHASNAAIQGSKSPIDLVRDFAHVGQLVSQAYILVVNPSLPVRSVAELVALAKARPNAVTYGSSGVGSVLHLAGEMLATEKHMKITHVPYKGAAPALADVVAGHIAMTFASPMSALPLMASGRARGLMVASDQRLSGAPKLPTAKEAGLPDSYEVTGWYGIVAPAGTPQEIIERLNRDINGVLAMPEVRTRMTELGTTPTSSTPAQFGKLVRSELEKWQRIVRQAGITPDAR